MLFDIRGVTEGCFESYKERNLYYKVFAGYLLNELIDGWKERLDGLCSLVHEGLRPARPDLQVLRFNPKRTHVSFDNHGAQLGIEGDRGEFADILIHDDNSALGIEVKYLTRVRGNELNQSLERLEKVKGQFGWKDVRYCLLTREGRRSDGPTASEDTPFSIVGWDEILSLCQRAVGASSRRAPRAFGEYLDEMLKRTRDAYRWPRNP